MDALAEVFSARGRANRSWYFWHIVLDDVLIITLAIALLLVGDAFGSGLVVFPLVGLIVAGFWAGTAITVKRLHDLGRSGWDWFLLLVPLYNVYLGCILLFKKGTDGPNAFGPDPLRPSLTA